MKDSSNTYLANCSPARAKTANLYLVNRGNMGKFSPTRNHIYQELDGALPGGMWGMPAYFNGKLYFRSSGEPLAGLSVQERQAADHCRRQDR